MVDESADTLIEQVDVDDVVEDMDASEESDVQVVITRKKERAKITQEAHKDAEEAVAMVGVAMASDILADEAMRATAIAEKSGDRERIKAARKAEREVRKKAKADHKAATESAKQAYDAIKFSDPNSMGFMRFVQVVFAIHIASVLILLVLTSRDTVNYSFENILDWLMVVLEGVSFFFFINRYKVGRPFVIGMCVIGLLLPTIFDVMYGTFNPIVTIVNGAWYIFLIFYFLFSRRVKATLVNDISFRKGEYEAENFVFDRRGWPFIRNLIIFFLVFSTLGHFMEIGMCQFIIMGLVEGEVDTTNTMLYRDLMFPFPMEGAVVVIIALFLYPFYTWLKKKCKPVVFAYIISFVTSALLCAAIEFCAGLIFNADLQNWDYSNQFGNIMGQVCLQNTIAFGAAASIINWWVYPLLEKMLARVPNDIMNIAFAFILMFNTIIWSLYIIVPPWISNENKTPEELAQLEQQQDIEAIQEERNQISTAIEILDASMSAYATSVQDNIGITDAEREKILAEIDEILTHMDAIEDTLNAELPEELIPPLESLESS
ncbi:MAG: putative ABC transporter permease [Eggerthellaceae bacterium]|nr:putative ABC transporter permease [Eggerthellaceae bacterium]